MLYFCPTPKLGPARAMLIERLGYYRGCYYRGSTVGNSAVHSIALACPTRVRLTRSAMLFMSEE